MPKKSLIEIKTGQRVKWRLDLVMVVFEGRKKISEKIIQKGVSKKDLLFMRALQQ